MLRSTHHVESDGRGCIRRVGVGHTKNIVRSLVFPPIGSHALYNCEFVVRGVNESNCCIEFTAVQPAYIAHFCE